MSDVDGYCSWCYEQSRHELVEHNWLRRNVYRCRSCGNRTLECRFCKDLTRGKEGLFNWDDELCAVHDGSIASFERLTLQIERLEDYEQIFRRDRTNILRVAKITAGVVGGVFIVASAALLAAPAIGGAIGTTIWGLSGAAATNAGLATLGGGALATGGFGMAGGVLVLTATGAALGGRLGGVVANSYFNDVEDFGLKPIKEGQGPAVIVVNGFLNQDADNIEVWKAGLQKRFANNPWYLLTWESKRKRELGDMVTSCASSQALTSLLTEAAKHATKQALGKVSPLGWILTAFQLVKNPWHVAMVKAQETGVLLADTLARVSADQDYVLIGHSLGARVIFSALAALATKQYSRIAEVHLLGGAVGKAPSEEWDQATQYVSGRVFNYFSRNDQVLNTMYRVGTFFTSDPIGYSGIGLQNGKIVDLDVSQWVPGHMRYTENLLSILPT